MRKNLEQKKARKLFHELRREDEGLAPSFAENWARASSQMGRKHPLQPFYQIAALAVILIVLSGSVVMTFRQPTPPFSDLVGGIRFDHPSLAQPVWLNQRRGPSMNDRNLP